MPKVIFTQDLQRYLDDPRGAYAGATVGEALDSVFSTESALRGHILDELGHLQSQIVVFVGGRPLRDRVGLSDPVGEQDEVWVMRTSPRA